MRHPLGLALLLLIATALLAGDKPRDEPPAKAGAEYRLTSMLHEPFGTVLTVQGVIVAENLKEYQGTPFIRVQRINGRATQKLIQVKLAMGWTDIRAELVKPEFGMSVELKGYETGGFVGVPYEALKGIQLRPAVPGFHFSHTFVFHESKKIDPIRWSPADFADREALLEGRAVSADQRAYIAGDGWRLLVDAAAPWPKDLLDKTVEGLGTVRKTDDPKTYRLEKGATRLVRLEDQVGRKVALRGRAWDDNGFWRFEYRGVMLYVSGMSDLPGWKNSLHGQWVQIEGNLEEGLLPDLGARGSLDKLELKKQFMIRKPSWKLLDSVLSPERVDH